MIQIAAYEVVLPALLGFLLIRALWPSAGGLLSAVPGIGIGIGLVSLCFSAALFAGLPPELAELLLAAGITYLWWQTGHRKVNPKARVPLTRLELALAIAFSVFLCYALGGWWLQHNDVPHGYWDAWAIWNLRARFLTTGFWRDGFSPLVIWSHPDYPLLLPGFVARTWRLTGGWSLAVPAVAAFLFTFGSVGLLTGSLVILKGRTAGFLGGIFLLCTPFFISEGTAQTADIPASFFLLATLVFLTVRDRFPEDATGLDILAGLSAGLAAWTKNEGLLLVAALILVKFVTAVRAGELRALVSRERFFILGAVPAALIIGVFKHFFATPNAHLGTQSAATILAMVTDPARHVAVVRGFVEHAFSFSGQQIALPLVLALWLACAGLDDKRNKRAIRAIAGTFTVMMAGYYVVFLISPWGVAWLVNTSLDRILMQMWPAVIFMAVLSAKIPFTILPSPRNQTQNAGSIEAERYSDVL